MQRQQLTVALLCAIGLAACSITLSSEQATAADAAASAAPPPPASPPAFAYESRDAATLDTAVIASPMVAKQAHPAARMRVQAAKAEAFAGGYVQA